MTTWMRGLWLRICFYAVVAISALFKRTENLRIMKNHEEDIAEGGTFTVTGSGSTIFKLPSASRPHCVEIDFDENCPPVVCNPNQVDELEWEVLSAAVHHHHRFELKISWNVSGIRRIRWSVVDGR